MIRIQKIGKLFLAFLMVAGLFSCNDDDNTEAFNVIGDVFITKRMINDEVSYANSYYAYGNQPMSEAKVTTPDDDEIVLSAANTLENTWAKQAVLGDFTTTIPTQGSYNFYVLNEDVPHETTDELTYNNIDFPTITSADVVDGVLSVEWEESTDAEGFILRLVNDSGDIIFGSAFISSNATQIQIDYPNTGSGTWAEGYPNDSDIYTLELQAFTFDNDASDLDYIYHIEEIAISEEEIIWE